MPEEYHPQHGSCLHYSISAHVSVYVVMVAPFYPSLSCATYERERSSVELSAADVSGHI